MQDRPGFIDDAPAGFPQLLTVAEVGAILGIARTSVYALMNRGELRYAAILPGCRRIERRALAEFLELKQRGPSAALFNARKRLSDR